jgi:hypothetical protein
MKLKQCDLKSRLLCTNFMLVFFAEMLLKRICGSDEEKARGG